MDSYARRKETESGRASPKLTVSDKFREALATELMALEKSLLSACERELAQVGEQEVERERKRLVAAEQAARELEQEVSKLRAERSELIRRAEHAEEAVAEAEEVAAEAKEAAETRVAADAEASRLQRHVQRLREENAELLRCLTPTRSRASNPGIHKQIALSSLPSSAASIADELTPRAAPSKSTKLHSLGLESPHRQEVDNQRHRNQTPTRSTKGIIRAESPSSPRSEADEPRGAKPQTTTPRSSRSKAVSSSEHSIGTHRVDLNTRQNFDKRTLRRMHRDPFLAAIRDWQAQHRGGSAKRSIQADGESVQVFVRCRPIFDKEKQLGEFEAVTAYEEWNEVVVHNCLFQPDLVRMYVQHSGFGFSRVFGPGAPNEEVCMECGSPLVSHALTGELATLFMFGQTGSGKTHTMNAILKSASKELFSTCDGGSKPQLKLKAFEILGKKLVDLLSDEREDLRLLEGEDGRTVVQGATELLARTPEECNRTVQAALSCRSTAGHGRNDESSRSHCVCMIEVPATGGCLVLVDCAGTERRQDTEQHSMERVREAAEINSSLHALKECIRYWQQRESKPLSRCSSVDKQDGVEGTSQIRVPYRGSQLTRVLQESFTRRGSRLFVIGTISPAAIDTEHSLSTLKTVQHLQSDPCTFESRADIAPATKAAATQSMKRDRSAPVLDCRRIAGTGSDRRHGNADPPRAAPSAACAGNAQELKFGHHALLRGLSPGPATPRWPS